MYIKALFLLLSGIFFTSGLANKTVPADLCNEPKLDTIVRITNGSTYVFRGDYFWEIKCWGLASGFPKLIDDHWSGLPSNLDASLTVRSSYHKDLDNSTFFFKGDQYWRFHNLEPFLGYPKNLSEGFPGIPGNLDAVVQWPFVDKQPDNNVGEKLFFFKGDQYWRFDSWFKTNPVPAMFPKAITEWGGVPENLDGAFNWDNERTYFFKNDLYYRYDDNAGAVEQSSRAISFPASIAWYWYKCHG